MANGQLRTVINQLRRLSHGGATLTDARLLEDFVSRRDEASFEVLVWRHGMMVLNLCQRVLRDPHEAEDAFQATFLVFARKASSVGKGESLASWLYKVAYRVALRMRTQAAKRHAAEEAVDDLPAPDCGDAVLWRDLRPVLDEEIDRLPEKYRAPFVLCYLQGHTNEEAAEQLGCPKGTILSRLARGRERLRSRLVRRGVALSAGCVATLVLQNASAASLPAALVNSTAKAATAFVAGNALTGLVSAAVVALTEGVLHTMFVTKMKIAAAALLALAVLMTGTALWTHEALAQRPPNPKPDTPAQRGPDAVAPQVREDAKGQDLNGKVVAVAKDGKSFTLEAQPPARGEEAKKIDVKIGDKTAITYLAVGPDGAKPTEGYQAKVRLAEGSKEVAATVTFGGTQNFRGPDLAGKVTAAAKDGKGITVEESGRAKARGEDAKTIEIKFNDKTRVSYSLIAKGGAKLVEGMAVEVWLVHGSADTAGRVHLVGKEEMMKRGDKQADESGKVVAVSTDGKTITLEATRGGRGREPNRVEIKVGDKTAFVFHNVEADGTKVVDGMQALVWLEEGSKDSAAKIALTAKETKDPSQVAGKVSSVGKDGKTIAVEVLEVMPGTRVATVKQIEIKLGDKTRIAYNNVGPNEAKPTEGYYANVRLADESKGTAAQILFTKPGGERGPRRPDESR